MPTPLFPDETEPPPPFVCSQCGETFLGGDEEEVDGEILCPECFDEDHTRCDSCGHVVQRADVRQSPDDDTLCDSCYDAACTECDCCHEVVPTDGVVHVGGQDLCDSCYSEHFRSCDSCGEECHIDDLHYHEDSNQDLCDSCYANAEDESSGIHSHDYKPTPQFRTGRGEPSQSARLFLGIELEVENTRNLCTCADMAGGLPDFTYAKRDGSLEGGFEIVSHPLSWQWLQENSGHWNTLLGRVQKGGFRSFETTTCGMHVHLSANAFVGSAHLYKFLRLFLEEQNMILTISGRSSLAALNKWAAFDDTNRAIIYKAKNKQNMGNRYSAVNLQNRHTVEVRVFRGTLAPDGFWKNLEFVHAAFTFTRDTAIPKVDKADFLAFVAENRKAYPHLHAFLVAKEMIS